MSKLRFFVYPAVAALALAAAMAARAQTTNAADGAAQPRTRAEVKAELAQAIADGSLRDGEGDYAALLRPTASTRTRAEVKAELAQARAQGWSASRDDDYPVLAAPAVPSTRTRAEVRAEFLAWRAQTRNTAYYGDDPGWSLQALRAPVPAAAGPLVAGAPALVRGQ